MYLEGVALTNEPNIRGGRPVANRWSAVARAASLAVWRAKAEARKKDEGGRIKDESVTGDGGFRTALRRDNVLLRKAADEARSEMTKRRAISSGRKGQANERR